MSILQQLHRESLLIATNVIHRIREANNYNHVRILRHDLTFVPQTRIILGRSLKCLLYQVRAEITQTLPPFLYFIVHTGDTHPTFPQTRIIKPKLPSGYTKGTVRRIGFCAGELQRTYPIDVLPSHQADI